MHRSIFAAAGMALLSVSTPASAGALVEAGELEHARANARAGLSQSAMPNCSRGMAAPVGPEVQFASRALRATVITGPVAIIATVTEFVASDQWSARAKIDD